MRLMTLLLVWLVLAGGLGCDKDNGSPGGTVSLTGAGATFPDPLYQKWAADYFRAHPGVRINYQGIGSGGGIKQIIEKTVDFGASDGPMTDEQLKKAPGELLHVPMTMGAVVPLYNLGGVDKPLVFSGPVLADLFLGKISKWDDPRLAALNPGLSLPDRPVTIVHRSDGSGTTYIWTDYLSKVSSEWASGPGKSTTVNWPVGRGAKGNDGVAGDVKQNEGSLGYVELVYAANNNIAFGDVVNAAGKRIRASEQTVSAAAAPLKDIPQDLRVSITNAPGDAAYPISSFTWMLLYKDQPEQAKGQALVEFLWWATHDGQAMAAPLHYAPLPREFTPLVEAKLRSVSVGGKPVVVAQR
jgi:phosphate transport system substrate-binding protein